MCQRIYRKVPRFRFSSHSLIPDIALLDDKRTSSVAPFFAHLFHFPPSLTFAADTVSNPARFLIPNVPLSRSLLANDTRPPPPEESFYRFPSVKFSLKSGGEQLVNGERRG